MPVKLRVALISAGLIALALLAYERWLAYRLAAAIDAQRVHIESVTELRATARRTHVAMLERWLSPVSEYPEREKDILARVQQARKLAAALAEKPALTLDEPPVRRRLLVTVTAWSNRVQQAIVSADGPEYMRELRGHIDAIDRDAQQTLDLTSEAGNVSRTTTGRLRHLQNLIQLGLLASLLGMAGLAVRARRAGTRTEQLLRDTEAARKQEARASEMRSQFFSNMSHELRTPLVTIRALANTMSERTGDVAVQDAAIRIEREAQDLLGTINNVLDAAKLEAGGVQLNLEDVDLSEVVARCVRRCEGLIGNKPVALEVNVPTTLPHVRADFVKLQQIFTNLIANAIKFTDSGRVEVRGESVPSGVVVLVSDTGVGIPQEALERIWSPFEQGEGGTERRFGGTGLGLSIVKSLVDLMHGRVVAESQIGKGTTFRVHLPTGGAV
jgi:signal transduction histidine kinase